MTDFEYLKKYYEGSFEEALEKLESGIPVQYIVGNVDFYGLNFYVNKNVLIPRFETEELIEKTIKRIKNKFNKKIDIIDLGTGSGCIAVSLKKNIDCNMTAIDISLSAIRIAKSNAIKNNVEINFLQRNMLNNNDSLYDVIISNPPYIAYDEEIMDIVKNNEPNGALYAKNDGLYFYFEIIKNSKNYLKDRSMIAFEIGRTQGLKIRDYALSFYHNSEIKIEKDIEGNDRFVFIFIDNKKKDNYQANK